MCSIELSRGMKCIGDGEPYCAIHQKFTRATSQSTCAKCHKGIRAGTYAIKRSDGQVEHQTCPEPRGK